MISFSVIDNNSLQNIEDAAAEEILADILSAFDEDTEIATTISHGCLLVRIFDYGRYSFLYPFELTDDAEVGQATQELVHYAVKEELPLVISDVPAEALGELLVGFTHADIDAATPDCESYTVKVKTECQIAEKIPEYTDEPVSLTPLTAQDTAPLAALSRDEEINRYWGYDFRKDFGSVDDSHFINEAESEFRRGVAMTFAVRCEGVFVGDAVLYAFDGRGRAHLGVRIMKEHQRRGYASAAITALFEIAKSLGMNALYAECHEENLPSKNMLGKLFTFIGRDEEKLLFEKELW
ncbi:MAG: GNAT family N-acetyltransferase [Clostridia bacterium]|nr:GNAT family N-acetyltransferase [Clostridia bacterium]